MRPAGVATCRPDVNRSQLGFGEQLPEGQLREPPPIARVCASGLSADLNVGLGMVLSARDEEVLQKPWKISAREVTIAGRSIESVWHAGKPLIKCGAMDTMPARVGGNWRS